MGAFVCMGKMTRLKLAALVILVVTDLTLGLAINRFTATTKVNQVDLTLAEKQFVAAKTAVLEDYLEEKNSPLADYAETFVRAAYQNQLDWRLLPAISGIESAFGQALLPNSHNPFGWAGGYLYFPSYKYGIVEVAKGLNEYKTKYGAITVEEIAPVYCPPNFRNWTFAVRRYMQELERLDQARFLNQPQLLT